MNLHQKVNLAKIAEKAIFLEFCNSLQGYIAVDTSARVVDTDFFILILSNCTEQMTRIIQPRIACYTHDTYGLGHIRRCLHILRLLAKEHPQITCLLITGSPALHFFKDLPPNIDFVKLPTFVKTGSSGSQPPHLRLGLSELTLWRSKIIRETVLGFQPDVFLVDNFPIGSRSELLPTLQELRLHPTKTILGIRDIFDAPDTVITDWRNQKIYQALDSYYDKVLIYGDPKIFDAVKAYEIPSEIAKKIHYCGYLTTTETVSKTPEEVRKELGIEGSFILASGGGGGDAYPLLSTFIEAQPHLPQKTKVVFMGPLMGKKDRMRLRKQAGKTTDIVIKDFVTDLRPYLIAADVVVSMCGYNTAAEILFHGAKAVVTPRSWQFGQHHNRKQVKKDQEQTIRAQGFHRNGLVVYMDPDQLTPKNLAEKVMMTIENFEPNRQASIDIQGLKNAVNQIKETIL